MIMRSTVKEKEPGGINPATKRHLESQIKTLQGAPRDADKLERLLKSKEKTKGKVSYLLPMSLFCRCRKKK
jgi:hypothetical protein